MKNAYIFCHHNTLIASFSAYLKPIKQYNKSSLNVVNRFLETATLSEMTYNKITPRCSSSNLFTTSNFVSVTFFFFCGHRHQGCTCTLGTRCNRVKFRNKCLQRENCKEHLLPPQ